MRNMVTGDRWFIIASISSIFSFLLGWTLTTSSLLAAVFFSLFFGFFILIMVIAFIFFILMVVNTIRTKIDNYIKSKAREEVEGD